MAKNTYTVSADEYLEHTDSYDGICIYCGAWTCGGVEPDAHGYACEACGHTAVMGAEQAVLEGYLVLE
jgi:hypothetical protein